MNYGVQSTERFRVIKLYVLGLLGSLVLASSSCKEDSNERVSASMNAGQHEDATTEQGEENETLGLTAQDCSNPERLNQITISPGGSLFINDPRVVNSPRATSGVWSFGFLLREVLELPVPGDDPAKLKIEQDKVLQFLDQFTNSNPVNSFVARPRPQTRAAILQAWGKTTGSDKQTYLTFDKAPFKLVAITNRMDISKKRREAITAGEGRFIFGFTGAGRMTLILEYNLPIGVISPTARTGAEWAMEWYRLKTFLADTNPNKAGIQPNQSLKALDLARPAEYLAALQAITDKFTLRTSRKLPSNAADTWAPLSQMRVNEFIQSPWELREIRRRFTTAGAELKLTTVKDNPDRSFARGGKGFNDFIAQNIACSNPGDRNSCRFDTPNGVLPPVFGQNKQPLLAASAPVDFAWFPNSNDAKQRFVALSTCSGCHQAETGTAFVHIDEKNGAPSRFLTADVQRRLINFKALVCLAANSESQLNLDASEGEDPIASWNLTH